MKVGVHVEGLNETLRAYNRYGKDANRQLREAAGAEVDRIIPALILAAAAAGPQAGLAGTSIRRRSDRVPVIVAAGSRRVRPSTGPKRRVTAGDVFFGAEFGGQGQATTMQFPPHRGHAGYWFWPTLRRHLPELRRRYIEALDRLAHEWARGGDEAGG